MGMFGFYWSLLRDTPGHAQTIWERAVFWIAGGVGVLALFNPEIAKSLQDSWTGASRLWSIIPLTFALLFRVARGNHAEFETLREQLDALRRTLPDPETRVVIANDGKGDIIQLEIHNKGASAEFSTQLRLSGTTAKPFKTVHARWDHDKNSVRSVIAGGTSERLRLARRVTVSGHISYGVYFHSDHGITETPSDPLSQRVELDITIIGTPSMEGGPIHRTVVLKSDGGVSLR